MNIFYKISLFFTILIPLFFLQIGSISSSDDRSIYFFYGAGCPHCAIVEEYFQKENIQERYDVDIREIYFNRENALLFNNLLTNLSVPQEKRGVPTVIIGKVVLTGDKQIMDNFVIETNRFLSEEQDKTIENKPLVDEQKSAIVNIDEPKGQGFELTLLAVIAGALVDAVNPCEFAVLIILMTTILASGNRRKALYSGIAFSVSIFISYLLMGVGLYQALGFGSMSQVFFKIVGWLAIMLGLFNLKDYFWYGKGVLMEVPLSWRPRLKKLIGSVTNPVGAFLVGFLVSLFLLPCTSGPYIVILGMLANNESTRQALLYLTLYNFIFVLPMILITFAVFKGFPPQKAEELRQKNLRNLHLVAGTILLLMGMVIIFDLL